MVDAEFQTSLLHLANRDLARRSLASGLVYLPLYIIVIAFTTYDNDHPAIMLSAGVAILFLVVLRTWLIHRFDRIYPAKPGRWLNGFTASTYMIAAVWGGMCAVAVHFYALEWTAMLMLLSAAGISAGAITTLSIRRHLIFVFLALLLLPAVAAATALQTREAIAITLMFITYFAFMFGIAGRINKEYWSALRNSVLLDQRARELEASNQELESYSYSIAHDLRTPLRTIISFSQILLEDIRDKCSESQRSHLKRVISAGKHMAQLIDDILELSRITRKDLDTCRTDLSELANTHARQLASHEPERSVHFDIETGLHATGDPKLLDIALQNLINNAWKFTANRADAEISFRSKLQDNETVYYLCDSGAGFDMTYAEKLFKPFQRLHHNTEFPGTGVGLASVQRIISRHGGKIWAEGEAGKGACFYFTLG